jgi:outer membrane receptor protein involved in Fe transport
MTQPRTFGGLLLLSTALVSQPAFGYAQTTTPPPFASAPDTDAVDTPQDAPVDDAAAEEQVEISGPGADVEGDIVVTGRYIPDAVRATPEVLSVLSTAEIARTGEGDIAGALQRVTGLSVVGNGFVFVRGLGDRYSLALLNGSPLPSPEPLKRVVPLDIFPSSIVASAVVQKSYSVNYPGEFGGGVINLTTKAIPEESFFSFGISGSGDSETTGKLGYTYYGSDTDFTGFDDGSRNVPAALQQVFDSGSQLVEGATFDAATIRDVTASLLNAPTTLLQRNFDIPMNFGADLSAGHVIDTSGGTRFGIIASAGYSNSWRTRDVRQQESNGPDSIGQDFRAVITDNRILVNGLLGFGAEFGEHKVRWTNLYIRDTLKQSRLAVGYDTDIGGADPVADPDFLGTPPVLQQNTYWFERQLIDTQLVGEFKFGDLSVDVRGTYANSQRESPYERSFGYVFDPIANDYVNRLSGAGQTADISFSDLNENVYGGSFDLAYKVPGWNDFTISAGYAYTDTARDAVRRDFQFRTGDGSALNLAVGQQRPDYLLSDFNIYTYNIQLRDITQNDPVNGAGAYRGALTVHAGYAQVDGEILPGLRASAGVRYEDGDQTVTPINIFPTDRPGAFPGNRIANDYWLPAATITWNFAEDMQFRAHVSNTIARPQFRELGPQLYRDYDSDRQYFGNQFLQDSELFNAEARYEYYFGRGERLMVAGFFKKIENPIETFSFFAGGAGLQTSFVNAPEAQLYGAEIEVQKYVPLDTLSDSAFFLSRRLVLVGNYTYSKSKLKVGDETVVDPFGAPINAALILRDGAPLTGQSDHIANLQIGLEDTERLSQQTFLITYASDRVTTRGPRQGDFQQPDLVEDPGLRLDFVAREGVEFLGADMEVKFEVRNITGREYKEYQEDTNRRIFNNLYDVGTSVSLGVTVKM